MEDGTSPRWVRRLREGIPLSLILVFLLAMLLRHVQQPLLERHSWRQVDTASFARGIAEGAFDVLHPQFLAYYPDGYGIGGAAETEFNLYPLLVSVLYRLFGVQEYLARLVSIGMALGTAAWVYLLGKRYLDRSAALLATLFLGFSPLFVFYSRSVQPEATALFLSVGAFYAFTRWLDTERRGPYVSAAVMAALGLLTKIPALYIGLPLLAAAWLKYRGQLLREWRLWLFAAVAILPTVAYYLFAHSLYQQSGLTVYGINGGWPGSGKFDLLGQWLDRDFYRVMLTRLRGLILGPYGFVLLLGGLAIAPRKKEEWLLYVWLGAVGLFIMGVAQGNRQHEYYQLPLVPVAALFIGKALSALLRPNVLNVDLLVLRRYGGIVLTVLFLALSLRNVWLSLPPLYAQSPILLQVAEATERLTADGAPVVILHDWARVPEVFYYAHRRGWALWLERTPQGEYGRLILSERIRTPTGWQVQEKLEEGIARIQMLQTMGASSLVVSLEKGDLDAFLRSPIGRAVAERYPQLGADEHWIIFDLRTQ